MFYVSLKEPKRILWGEAPSIFPLKNTKFPSHIYALLSLNNFARTKGGFIDLLWAFDQIDNSRGRGDGGFIL